MATTTASSGEGEGTRGDSGAGDDLTPPVDWTAIWNNNNNNNHDGGGRGANGGTNDTAGVAGGDDDDNNGDYTVRNLMRLAHTRHYESLWWIQSQQKQHQKENLDDDDDDDDDTAPTTTTSDTLDPLEGVVTDISSTMIDFYKKQEQTQLLEPFVVPSGMNISFGQQQEEEQERGGGGGGQ
mmetsp:Transcript_56953/g.138734  ORF Transcript_56953/g.138734 Transcript_56953/m.138734 type:complete len:181 (+) Transcript_56953:105-647(+)